MPKPIRAKLAADCPLCPRRLRPGDIVFRDPTTRDWAHRQCVLALPEVAERERQPPRPKVRPTALEIDAARTERGGFTKATLAQWGVRWPPPKGWRDKLIAGEDPNV